MASNGRSSGREVFSTGSTIPEKTINRPVVLVQLRDERKTQEEEAII